MKRIVIKIGSKVLSREDGTLDQTRVSSIVDQVVRLRRAGYEIILVSSGAVACGRSLVKAEHILDSVEQRQLYSAVGQAKLIDTYYRFFSEYGIPVGQVLTMKRNFSSQEECSNQKQCMSVMLGENVIPIVNENDTVCITELMFTDNDELSGLVAEMMGAQELVILTNVDGVYDGDPAEPGSRLIRTVRAGDDLSSCICETGSTLGRGGMQSKVGNSLAMCGRGIRVVIANGKSPDILTRIFEDPESTPFTQFLPL